MVKLITLFFSLLFLNPGFISAQEAPTVIKLSDYTITIIEKNIPHGAILDVTYFPYLLYKNENIFNHRYQGPINPLGAREDWGNIPSYTLANWVLHPDLMTTDIFHVALSSNSAEGWSRLMLADQLVIEYLSRNNLKNFIDHNKDNFSKTIERLRSEIGKPESYPFVDKSNIQKMNQYALEDTFALLKNKSVYFQPNPDLEQVFLDFNFLPSIKKKITLDDPMNKHPLIVVHTSKIFDDAAMAKEGVDYLINKFKVNNLPVVYLMHHDGYSDLMWYPEDRNPDYAVYSAGGEHNLPLYNPEVTIVGGFFGDYDGAHGCHFKAMADAITRYFLHGKFSFKIHLPISAIYFYSEDESSRDEFLDERISPLEFIDYIHESFFFTFDETYLGGSTEYTGIISTTDYTFLYFVDDVLIKKHGVGDRTVEFRFSK